VIFVVDKESMDRYAEEERHIRQENLRLQRKLQMEIERREQLCRRLSESESSMEMDEERCWLSDYNVYTGVHVYLNVQLIGLHN